MAQDWATRNAIAAGELAAERGEYFTPREVMQGLAGRTKGEAIAWYSAVADRQDAEQRARLRRMGYRDDLSISEDFSADTSAPHPDDVARDAETLARGRAARARRREIAKVAGAMDRVRAHRETAQRERMAAALLREVGY